LILSLGSINADFQLRVDRRPEVNETLIGRDFLRLGGGRAANVAFFARKLGLEACLLAQVGDDDLAEQALAPLRNIGVDLSRVAAVEGCGTGVAMITVQPDGKKGIVAAGNANEAWTSEQAAEVVEVIEEAPKARYWSAIAGSRPLLSRRPPQPRNGALSPFSSTRLPPIG
jgi:ribokinase